MPDKAKTLQVKAEKKGKERGKKRTDGGPQGQARENIANKRRI
jgi:hypothetical protein